MKDHVIREIKVTDYKKIYSLNKEFNSNYNSFYEDKVQKRIELILKDTKDIIFVYEINGEVVGYIHGSPYELLFSESLINVLGFIVNEKYRNMMIGTNLIDKLECWAKDNEYSGIKLLTHPSRTDAHRFYEAHGYFYTKDQKNYMKLFK